jgi:phage terminase small subunit
MRGRLPKPTAMKRLEGNPGKRTLPKNEPQFAPGVPRKPGRMSAGAKKVWDELVEEMQGAAILQTVDQRALWQLAEDEALLVDAYEGFWSMVGTVKRKAATEGKELPAGAVMAVLSMENGRKVMNSIRDLASRVIVERREFGLTPSARTRIAVSSKDAGNDALDDAIFNGRAQLLVLPKSG